MEASLAPLGVILDLDHTDSVTIPGLGHVANRQYGVLTRVILKNVIIIMTISATCNGYVPMIWCMKNEV